MSANHENDLLAEYNSQVENVLSEDEKKKYDEFSFYEVYEVEIGGIEAEGGICCPICLFGGIAFFLFCLPDPVCACTCFSGCCSECGGDFADTCKEYCGSCPIS